MNMMKSGKLPSMKNIISTVASAAGVIMVVDKYMPRQFKNYFYRELSLIFTSFSSEITLIIEEHEELTRNQLFTAAKLYLATLTSPNLNRFKASLPLKEDKIIVTMTVNEETIDVFRGVEFKWRFSWKKIPITHVHDDDDESMYTSKSHSRYYQLIFNKKHKDFAVNVYLPYLLSKSKEIEEEKKTMKLYTLRNDRNPYKKSWISIKHDHPSNFETLAMDYETKKMIMDDLELFVKRKEYYKRVGKAWKRGYLLFGPPGTGKSSLIAAMATFLNFDIYDLQLTDLRNNTELRKLLISTGNRSILVVEDIDCSMEFHNRKKQPVDQIVEDKSQITLSGFLNFIDGLWSSCGDERIIIFTSNDKDRLDPALLRPGRMDMHIHMSYCTPSGFRQLAYKFLAFAEHPLFEEIEKLIQVLCVTPADVSERLMKIEDPEMALEKFFEFLQQENEKKEAKNAEERRARMEGQKAEGDEKIQT